jgi:hypothetical protein
MIEFNEEKQNQKLQDLHRHEEEELVQFLAAQHGSTMSISPSPSLIPTHSASSKKIPHVRRGWPHFHL